MVFWQVALLLGKLHFLPVIRKNPSGPNLCETQRTKNTQQGVKASVLLTGLHRCISHLTCHFASCSGIFTAVTCFNISNLRTFKTKATVPYQIHQDSQSSQISQATSWHKAQSAPWTRPAAQHRPCPDDSPVSCDNVRQRGECRCRSAQVLWQGVA